MQRCFCGGLSPSRKTSSQFASRYPMPSLPTRTCSTLVRPSCVYSHWLSLISRDAISHIAELSYLADIEHYSTTSTTDSVCSVEPGTAEDVGTIVRYQIYDVLCQGLDLTYAHIS